MCSRELDAYFGCRAPAPVADSGRPTAPKSATRAHARVHQLAMRTISTISMCMKEEGGGAAVVQNEVGVPLEFLRPFRAM